MLKALALVLTDLMKCLVAPRSRLGTGRWWIRCLLRCGGGDGGHLADRRRAPRVDGIQCNCSRSRDLTSDGDSKSHVALHEVHTPPPTMAHKNLSHEPWPTCCWRSDHQPSQLVRFVEYHSWILRHRRPLRDRRIS